MCSSTKCFSCVWNCIQCGGDDDVFVIVSFVIFFVGICSCSSIDLLGRQLCVHLVLWCVKNWIYSSRQSYRIYTDYHDISMAYISDRTFRMYVVVLIPLVYNPTEFIFFFCMSIELYSYLFIDFLSTWFNCFYIISLNLKKKITHSTFVLKSIVCYIFQSVWYQK